MELFSQSVSQCRPEGGTQLGVCSGSCLGIGGWNWRLDVITCTGTSLLVNLTKRRYDEQKEEDLWYVWDTRKLLVAGPCEQDK
jgi:hypothetical protein